MQTNINTPLSGLQLELLRIYSFDPSKEELQEIKTLLGKYFARKFINNVDKAVTEKNITDSDLDSWLNEVNQ